MLSYKLWLENRQLEFPSMGRGLVSFDFDGVLHTSMHPGTIHPDNWDSGDLPPRKKYIKILKEEAKQNEIIIVSARCQDDEENIWEFVNINKLPVKDVITTCMAPKVPILIEMGAIRHYDDDIEGIRRQMEYFKPQKLQFIPVPPVQVEDMDTRWSGSGSKHAIPRCPHCGEKVKERVSECPWCGEPL